MKKRIYKIVRISTATLIAGAFLSTLILTARPHRASAEGDRQETNNSERGSSRVRFEENRGQFDERAKFIVRGAGHTMFLAPTEAVYVLPMAEERPESMVQSPKSRIEEQPSKAEDQKPSQAYALRMQFVGADPAAQVSGVDEQAAKTNFFRGKDPSLWLTDVPTYSRVRYEEVYPNIDLEFYANSQDQSQYDFIVRPEGDASQIELFFDGADSVEIDPATGELLINTAVGTLRESKPFTYQESAGLNGEVPSAYEIIGANRVRFTVADYDRSKPLVIDPALNNLAFSTFLGGGNADEGYEIIVDSAGNIFIAGETDSDLFPTTSGPFDTTVNGSDDLFVTKMTPDGSSLIYSTYIGGSGFESLDGIAIDDTGSVFLTGWTISPNFPVTAGAFDTTLSGFDTFVTKLNATGNQLIYSTYFGGTGTEQANSIAIDSAGSAYVTGVTNSADLPTTPESFNPTSNGGEDAFLAKLNSDGTALVYSTYLGGNSSDAAYDLMIDPMGGAIVTGNTRGGTTNVFPTTAGAYDTTHNGGNDVFVTKFNADGSELVFSTFLGSSGDEHAVGIATDPIGNIYLTGRTPSNVVTPFPVAGNVFDNSLNGGLDIFVSKLSSNGTSLIYSTYIGGSTDEYVVAMAVDPLGNVYITGQAAGVTNSYPTTPNAFRPTYGGNSDAFVTKLSSGGSNLTYSTFLGGGAFETAHGIALDTAGNVYVTGNTNNPNYPVTENAFQTDFAGGHMDAYVTKFGNFAIAGRAIDASGAAIPNTMIALSGHTSATTQTDAGGNFIFLDALPNRAYTVSATRAGTVFNPSLFNIADLNSNRNLIFVAGGSPSGGGGGNLFFSSENYSVNEPENTATIRVWRGLQTINNSVSVNYTTANGTATAGSDYVSANGTLTFGPGEVEKTFDVPINDDVLVEGSETVGLVLSDPTGGATLGTNTATLSIHDNGEPQLQALGQTLGIVVSGGVFKGRHIAGIAASQTDGTIYVATDKNSIEPPTGLTNNCGMQPDQNAFDLFRIAPGGTVSLIGNYQITHRALVNLELNAADGMLYTIGSDRKVYRIHPATGSSSVFNSDVGFDTERYGLEADASGALILMRYGDPNSFYRVSAGNGATFLGSYAADGSSNFGDRFGIRPDGDYVVYSDAPANRNPREFRIETNGHVEGAPYNFNYLTGTNIRSLGSGYIHSNGAVNPINGDVYTSGGNCSAGSSVILRTPADGNANSASTVFISGIGNGYLDGGENYNARGVTDLDFGARRDGRPGACLYFADDHNDVIYQSCSLVPTAARVSVSGRVTTASGLGVYQGVMSLTSPTGETVAVRTNPFGYFRFDGVSAGQSYVASVDHKRFAFDPKTISVMDDVAEVNFVARP